MSEYKDAPEDKIKHFVELWSRLDYYNFNTLLDVGAGECPLKFATHVIDYMKYEDRGQGQGRVGFSDRFSKETWNQSDFFNIPWPYPDKFFDFVNCTQTLEDIRDPIGLCKEMIRVGKAGLIECPNIVSEMSALFFHHRWFVRVFEGKLQFLHKSALLNITPEVKKDIIKLHQQRIHPNRATTFEWKDSFEVEEVYCKDEKEYYKVIDQWVQHDLKLHGGLR